MTITRLELKRFTAFEALDLNASPGVNVLVGANGTGKTHLMKVAYAACAVSKTQTDYAEKLIRIFMPTGKAIGRLVKRRKGRSDCSIRVSRHRRQLEVSFSNRSAASGAAEVTGRRSWHAVPVASTYVPAKEMLANAPGFRSLYSQREIHFEEIYADILDRAHGPAPHAPASSERERLLATLRKAIDGKARASGEEFFLHSKHGNLEFSLLGEGTCKLGLLWLLIRNGTLFEGAVLFWDEPETNLNPKLFNTVVKVLLELHRLGVQIFIATHNYSILKEFDLQKAKGDKLAFHSLYHRDDGEIANRTVDSYLDIYPNAIAEAFDDLYDREVRRSLARHWA